MVIKSICTGQTHCGSHQGKGEIVLPSVRSPTALAFRKLTDFCCFPQAPGVYLELPMCLDFLNVAKASEDYLKQVGRGVNECRLF